MSSSLSLRGVVKRFGPRTALDGLDLDVPEGSIFGLIGSNGAGKTTAFSVVGGFLRPDAGRVDILGEGPFDPDRHSGRIAILPQDSLLPPHATARELLVFYAQLQGLSSAASQRSADDVLAWVHLTDRAASSCHTLSHGMRRRLVIAQAFLGSPELVLLDEPLSGLDPVEMASMRDLIRRRRGRQTIILSSHDLHAVELICERVAFIEKGRTVRQDSLEAVTERKRMLVYAVEPGPIPLDRLKERLPDAVFETPDGAGSLICRYGSVRTAAEVNSAVLPILLESGVRLLAVEQGTALEKAYLDYRAGAPNPPRLPPA